MTEKRLTTAIKSKNGRNWAVGDVLRFYDLRFDDVLSYTLMFGPYTYNKERHFGFYFDDGGYVLPFNQSFKDEYNYGPE